MAFNKIFSGVMVVFVLVGRGAVGAIAPESQFEEGVSPVSSSKGDQLPPTPSPEAGENEFYVDCAEKITDDCGNNIFSNIFLNETKPVTKYCCGKLVSAGRQCHDGLVKFITSTPEFKGNASITVPRSVEAWNKCVLVAAGDVSPSPSP